MAATKETQDKDVIARLADKGEETLRWIVGTPRRMVADVRGGVDARLHDLASKLRAIDPLDSRVAASSGASARSRSRPRRPLAGAPTRAKAPATRRAGTAQPARGLATTHGEQRRKGRRPGRGRERTDSVAARDEQTRRRHRAGCEDRSDRGHHGPARARARTGASGAHRSRHRSEAERRGSPRPAASPASTHAAGSRWWPRTCSRRPKPSRSSTASSQAHCRRRSPGPSSSIVSSSEW